MIFSSFKMVADVYTYPEVVAQQLEVHQLQEGLPEILFGRYYFNSIFTSVAQTAIQLALSVTAAYALVVLNFPGRKFLYTLIRSTMFVPTVVTLIPLYLLVSKAGMIDTYAGIILPQVLSAFTIFLLISFFSSIPTILFDSAKLDGCYYRFPVKCASPPRRVRQHGDALRLLGHWKSYTWPDRHQQGNLPHLPIG